MKIYIVDFVSKICYDIIEVDDEQVQESDVRQAEEDSKQSG
jgi:hypothetical protein